MKFFVVFTRANFRKDGTSFNVAMCNRIECESRSDFERYMRNSRIIHPDIEEVPLSCVMKAFFKDTKYFQNTFYGGPWPYPFPIKKDK